MTRESELAKLAGKYPLWEAWKGVSGLFYARRRGTTDDLVSGEDITDLADQIDRAQRLAEPAEQPAEHLARIRRGHPLWSIRHVTDGFGWTAQHGEARIWAGTLTDLEAKLRDAAQGTP